MECVACIEICIDAPAVIDKQQHLVQVLHTAPDTRPNSNRAKVFKRKICCLFQIFSASKLAEKLQIEYKDGISHFESAVENESGLNNMERPMKWYINHYKESQWMRILITVQI